MYVYVYIYMYIYMYIKYIYIDIYLTNKGAHEPLANVFYISRVFSNVWSVLSQCSTQHMLLYFLYNIEVMRQKTKHAFSMFYTLIKDGFLTNQSMCQVLSILFIYIYIYIKHNFFVTRHTHL